MMPSTLQDEQNKNPQCENGYDSWQKPLSSPLFDAVAELGFREVLKSLMSNIWLRQVSVTGPKVRLD